MIKFLFSALELDWNGKKIIRLLVLTQILQVYMHTKNRSSYTQRFLELASEVVSHKKTSNVLFYKKSHPTFRTNLLPMDSTKTVLLMCFQWRMCKWQLVIFEMQRLMNKYCWILEMIMNFYKITNAWRKRVSFSSHRNEERSKILGEVAICNGPQSIIEDA